MLSSGTCVNWILFLIFTRCVGGFCFCLIYLETQSQGFRLSFLSGGSPLTTLNFPRSTPSSTKSSWPARLKKRVSQLC